MHQADESVKTGVKIPMMPKGVEHVEPTVTSPVAKYVKIPMMPKGVEHCGCMST